MKKSVYNYHLQQNGNHFIYNTYSDAIIQLDETLMECYSNMTTPEVIVEMNELHIDFVNYLKEFKFLVPIETNEYEVVKSELNTQFNDESKFRLIINPTMNCNFKCWYCYEDHVKSSKMNEDIIERTQTLIFQKVSNPKLKTFELDWFGGEPLLQYNSVVVPILSFTRELCEQANIELIVGFTTNGFLIDDNMIASFKEQRVNSFQITLDGGKEEHNKIRNVSKTRGSYDEIVENIHKLVQNELNVSLRFNCTQANCASIYEVTKSFENIKNSEYLEVEFHGVWQEGDTNTPELIALERHFKNNGFSVSPRTNRIIDNACYADKRNETVINYDGNVFKCTARNFTKENALGILNTDGEINFNEEITRRNQSRFTNKPCMECKIFPICGGGCSQHEFENVGTDYCVYDFDEHKKREHVNRRFEQLLNV